jgi:hypothetical protein
MTKVEELKMRIKGYAADIAGSTGEELITQMTSEMNQLKEKLAFAELEEVQSKSKHLTLAELKKHVDNALELGTNPETLVEVEFLTDAYMCPDSVYSQLAGETLMAYGKFMIRSNNKL